MGGESLHFSSGQAGDGLLDCSALERMKRDLAALSGQTFDLLVIGGGIFGAGVARDAALRGLRVALIDKADFASSASSCSSKLIHGGFRYLEQYAFGLVAEACRERRILQLIAPHLVRPLPFLLPVYEGDPRSFAKIRLGMTLYDLMARYQNVAPHQSLSPDAALVRESSLARHGLRGAVLFYDCQEDDARFCLENVLHAAVCGAVCANYCEAAGFVTRGNRIAAARVTNQLGGSEAFEIAAHAFVNAAGPWVEAVADLCGFNGHRVALSPAKGVHLLLPRLTQQHAIAFQSRRDGRILFVIPWGEYSIVGTTDADWRGDPARVRAEPADIDYLLAEVRTVLPGGSARSSEIITTFAGIRALLRSGIVNPSRRSREHRVVRHGENLVSIAGGKYTTYRAIAEEAVDLVCRLLGTRAAPCRTAEVPLPEHRPPSSKERIADAPAVYASDIDHACEHEMAVTVSDVMRRRTGLALSRHGGTETAAAVAELMAPLLGWSDDQKKRSLQQYLNEWTEALP